MVNDIPCKFFKVFPPKTKTKSKTRERKEKKKKIEKNLKPISDQNGWSNSFDSLQYI